MPEPNERVSYVCLSCLTRVEIAILLAPAAVAAAVADLFFFSSQFGSAM